MFRISLYVAIEALEEINFFIDCEHDCNKTVINSAEEPAYVAS